MGARGGRGDSGTPGKFATPSGESGGELTGDLNAILAATGLGLEGRPGLMSGAGIEIARVSGAPLKTPARDAGSRGGMVLVV